MTIKDLEFGDDFIVNGETYTVIDNSGSIFVPFMNACQVMRNDGVTGFFTPTTIIEKRITKCV